MNKFLLIFIALMLGVGLDAADFIGSVAASNSTGRLVAPTNFFFGNLFAGTNIYLEKTNRTGLIIHNSAPASAGGDQVWTNDSGVIHPISTNGFYVYPWGGWIVGSNTLAANGAPLDPSTSFLSYHVAGSGDNPLNIMTLSSISDMSFGGGSEITTSANTNGTAVISLVGYNNLGNFQASLGAALAGNASVLIVKGAGASEDFRVTNGNISLIRGINYTWPPAQGSDGTDLTNNGSGLLGWWLNPWSAYPTNVWNSRQGGSLILTNLAGTGALTNDSGFQPASATLTNLAANPYKGYTNQVFGGTNTSVRTAGGTNFIDTTGELNNWVSYPTNVWNSRQGGSAVLTNLVGTGAITNVALLVWTNDAGNIYPVVDRPRIEFTTNRIFGRLLRADGTNTVFGSNALPPGHASTLSTAIGYEALSLAGGEANTAVGHRSSVSNSSGSFNVSIGTRAMEFTEYRSDNVAVGYESLRHFTTGFQNTAVGGGAMGALTTSYNGTALGWGAMDGLGGIGNTALGAQALINTAGDGNYNLAVGFESMESSGALEGTVALGSRSLYGISTLTNMVAIGYGATAISGGLTNSVAIGANTRITANNQMMLGTNITEYVLRNLGYRAPSSYGSDGFVLTNDGAGNIGWNADKTSAGASSLSSNANQFLGVPLAIKSGALLTNTAFHGGITMTNSDSQTQTLRVDTTATTNALSVESNGIVSIKGTSRFINIGESSDPGTIGIEIGAASSDKPSIARSGLFSGGGNLSLDYNESAGGLFIQGGANYYVSVGYGGTAGFVGIGMTTETPSALLSVGSGSTFQVDGAGTVRSSSIVLTNVPGLGEPFLRIAQTNGRGYSGFTTTNSVIATNRFVMSFGSNTVSAGQLFGVHSTAISGGINNIVVTNDPGTAFQPANSILTNLAGTGALTNMNGMTNTPIMSAGNLYLTNQLLRVDEDFNGGTVFTNLDFTGSIIKVMTNAITGSRTNNLTNAVGGASMIVYVVGETATATDRNYTFTAASSNIRWMNSPTNANSIDVLIHSNQVYTFWFDVVTNATGPATNIIARWMTDSPRPILNRAVPVSAGAGTSNAWMGGRVFLDATTKTTNLQATAVYTNLFTFTVPGNTLTNVGDELEFYLSGHFKYGTANTNGFKCIYGTSTLFDTGFLTISNCPWKAIITITGTGGSAQRAECEVIAQSPAAGAHGNGTLTAYRTNMPLAQVNGTTNIFAFQGTSRVVAAITNDYRRISWNPGPR